MNGGLLVGKLPEGQVSDLIVLGRNLSFINRQLRTDNFVVRIVFLSVVESLLYNTDEVASAWMMRKQICQPGKCSDWRPHPSPCQPSP